MSDVPKKFQEMDYETNIEDSSDTKKWLRQKYGPFINGKWRIADDAKFYEIKDSLTGKSLTTVRTTTSQDIDDAIESSVSTHDDLKKYDSFKMYKLMNVIASFLEKQSRLFSHIDSLSRGVLVKDPKQFDVPAMVKVFKYYASSAYDTSVDEGKLTPEPVTVGIMTENTPLIALAWLVAPALASRSNVCLVVPHNTALSAMVFAQICFEASGHDKLLNVLPGDLATVDKIVAHNKVSSVVYFGPTAMARHIREITSGGGKLRTAVMSGKTSMLVFDSADLDSAVESVVKYAWYNHGTVPWVVKKLFVQEPVFQIFVRKLKSRLQTLRIGQPFDLFTDVGPRCEIGTRDAIAKVVLEAREAGIEVFEVEGHERVFCLTVLIGEDVQANCLLDDEVSLPVISVIPFRTAKEAVSLANNTRYGFAASIWLESAALSALVADQLQVGTVWINSHGLVDPAVPFGGWKESGIGCFGGIKLTHMKASCKSESKVLTCPKNLPMKDTAHANRVDVHKAVQAAVKAQAQWSVALPGIRARTLHTISERFDTQRQQLISCFSAVGDSTSFDSAISMIHSWAWYCASEAGLTIRPSVANTTVKVTKEPLGVVGIGMNREDFLVPLLWTVAAALCYGNAVVIALDTPISKSGSAALKTVVDVVPAGLVTVLTGDVAKIMETLAQHQSVDAIWFPECSGNVAKAIEKYAARDMKRLCVNTTISYHREFLEQKLMQNKAVWLPKGSDIC